MSTGKHPHGTLHAQRYLVTGILTVIPIWITWWVFEILFSQLSRLGAPWVRALAHLVKPVAPGVGEFLLQPWFQFALAVFLTLLALYGLGWLTTQVLGRRLLESFDRLMDRIPMVARIYGASKRLLSVLQKKPESVERVVFISFPSPEMRALGLVTRTFKDSVTGRELAAVYVPTTPNPTSGYVEIVPVDDLVATDWTLDEAMAFVISAGSIGPEQAKFTKADDV
ncbi:hypothetical protein CAI21_20105 [Alkalilimnicola ehrlichii]|uniref:DUF502 domain-containing protein n=1 Tax=Alkalilimnicola ehrlichii TaxID=351052 RepID=A0A3E0X2I1_9GAMM|nr:DUF502 domain-containing protein [Alkalilimnicola ehrlichii]RFA25138.1 hypothetical protein CAI21_20105 [Alkalilimnicola ehrlichii]RFA38803.1 hypothetical protein CAL65_02510 [Alkalilimnicola ehrlichii]